MIVFITYAIAGGRGGGCLDVETLPSNRITQKLYFFIVIICFRFLQNMLSYGSVEYLISCHYDD